MFCANCGAQNKDEAKFCVKCGQTFIETKKQEGPASLQPAGIPPAEPLFLKGVWVVIRSFFSLPYKFITDTFSVIRKIGKEGRLLFESTDIPFLNWMFTTGRVLITLVSFIIIFIGFILGIIILVSAGSRYGGRNIISGFFGMIFVWTLSVVVVFIQIWLSALWLELIQTH
jgi:ribosomal protein L40E